MIPLTALTTLAHLIALEVSPSFFYSSLIVTNTGLSFFWHLSDETSIALSFADHGVALLWGLTDLYYGYQRGVFIVAFVLNFAVSLLNMPFTPSDSDRDMYISWHSAWHLVSAYKAFVLASLLSSSTQM